ncbi:Krr1-domain-containing protein [Amanita rubescens]|nr:Krr1-domain-containing protein [Amanita rubescens]
MLSDSSDNEETHQLTVNEHFAKAYQHRKEREELQKLKDKYGSDFEEEEGSDESTDSESAESEDEDGQELTPAVDAAILRTLAMIKRKDPAIYIPGKDVYNEEEQRVTNPSSQRKKKKDPKDKSKPVTLRQVAFETVLEGESRSPSPGFGKPTHVEEQQVLRNETIAAFHGAVAGEDEDGDESDEGGGLLVPREKTKDEMEREEEEYRAYLKKEVGSDLEDLITVEKVNDEFAQAEKSSDIEVDAKKKKKKKKSKESKVKSKEQEDHEFLMSYILNRGWIDKSSGHIPTYKEVTSSKKSKSKSKAKSPIALASESDSEAAPDAEGGSDAGDSELDSDASFESLNDHFESSYNFRFEEPGADKIPTFPRNLPNTVRRQDSTRKDARARKQERKEAELEQKREEVRRLKNLKMKEIRKKLEMIGKEGGRGKNVDEDQALHQLDLDAEWDPDEHDKQMTRLYTNDADAVVDEEKPMWEDDIDIGDIHISGDEQPNIIDDSKKDKKKKKKKKDDDEDHMDEGGVDIDEMDADVVRDDDEEEWDGTEEMRKRKLKEYMGELDALDFNDVVAGMKTRFRYAPVKSESFALTPVEILMATDQELNQYVSIRKYAPYRRDAQWDNNRNEKLRELKKQIAERMGRAGMDAGDGEADRHARGSKPAKKRKGRKERMKAKAAIENGEEDEVRQQGKREREDEGEQAVDGQGEEDAHKKKRKRRHKKKEAELA